jgi:fido (protein-threonine AMPylation protein)
MKDVGTEEEFLEKTALLYKNLILIHPFREGNGRSIRTYIIEIAKNAGVKLDFSKINNNIQAKRSQKKISECTIPQVISLLKTCIVQARP